jgi:hypothetical protein
LQRKGWRSSLYGHFQPPVIIEVKGEILYRFICKRNPSQFVQRHRFEDSTSNLARHVEKCSPSKNATTEQMAAFVNGSTYSSAKFRFLLAVWCARRHRPFSIVADPELHDLFKMLHGRVEIPHPITISRDVKEIFTLSKIHVARVLGDYKVRVHIGVDGWTSPNIFSFLGITAHRVVDGRINSCILDFVKLLHNHSGIYLANQLVLCLREFKLETKVSSFLFCPLYISRNMFQLLGVVCDNAANNGTMVKELGRLLETEGFGGEASRVRCFAHTLNLVVKAILRQFSRSCKTTTDANVFLDSIEELDDDEDVEAAEDLDTDRELADEAVLAELDEELDEDDDVDIVLTDDDIKVGCFAVFKVGLMFLKVGLS